MASAISFGDKNKGLQAGIINGAVEFYLPPGELWDRLSLQSPSEH
jgi:hypothetical protein